MRMGDQQRTYNTLPNLFFKQCHLLKAGTLAVEVLNLANEASLGDFRIYPLWSSLVPHGSEAANMPTLVIPHVLIVPVSKTECWKLSKRRNPRTCHGSKATHRGALARGEEELTNDRVPAPRGDRAWSRWEDSGTIARITPVIKGAFKIGGSGLTYCNRHEALVPAMASNGMEVIQWFMLTDLVRAWLEAHCGNLA
jgi:hypothetical protein